MKTAIKIVQIFVGVLFIVSGLVKANDPMGLSYKMQEFFELWNAELSAGSFFLKSPLMALYSFLHDHSLFLSVMMITLEIIAGVAILLGFMKNFFLWLLLILIIFFTFLTGYAFLSGKFTNCGCFGDCLPITPLTSFIKDLLLLVMIIFLLFGRRYIVPAFSAAKRKLILALSLFFSLLLQWYVLNYLPLADCLPFKKGNNITQQMLPPPGSVPDSFAMKFIYEKEGKQFEFAPEELPADLETYKFIDRIDKLVRKGNAEPAIKNFSLSGITGEDSTKIVLAQPAAILVFAQDLKAPSWTGKLNLLSQQAKTKGIPVYLATPASADAIKLFDADAASIQFFNADFTIVRTAARTEPTIYYLEAGTIKEKYSQNGFDAVNKKLTGTNIK
jgi:uncharacterized membrane protein YphA (DoxX/SURF4 family)